jgi:hypothetical protein
MRRKHVLVCTIVTNYTKETKQLTRSRVLGSSEQLVKSRVDHIGDIAQIQLLHKQRERRLIYIYYSTVAANTIRKYYAIKKRINSWVPVPYSPQSTYIP